MNPSDFTQSEQYREFLFWKYLQTQSNPSSSNDTPFSETPNVPETQRQTPFSQVSLDDLLLSEGRSDMTELNPNRIRDTTWFGYDPSITKSALQMMKSDLPNFSPTYEKLPEDVKLRWFKSFAQEFNWNPTFTSLVRKEYDAVAKYVFSSQVCTWKRGWINGKGPPQCLKIGIGRENVWNGFITYWKSDDAENISNKNKRNQNSQRGGDGKAAHTTGSKSYVRRFEEMTRELGKPPNMVDFMIDTHTSKKQKTIIDKKAARIAESLKGKIDVILSEETQDESDVQSNSLSQAQVDALYLEEIKGSRFGIGSLPIGRYSSSAQDPTTQVELLNAKAKIAEMKKTQEEQARKLDDLEARCMKHIQNSRGEEEDN